LKDLSSGHRSPGYGISLVSDIMTGCLIGAEWATTLSKLMERRPWKRMT